MLSVQKKLYSIFHIRKRGFISTQFKNFLISNTDERNQRGHKQMEKYTVFMDWKNQYCQNGYTTQSNL